MGQGQVPSPALESQQLHAMLHAQGIVAKKLSRRKSPGCVGH